MPDKSPSSGRAPRRGKRRTSGDRNDVGEKRVVGLVRGLIGCAADYEATNDPELLERGVRYYELLTSDALCPGFDVDVAAVAKFQAACIFARRFERYGEPADIERAVELFRETVAALDRDAPERLTYLNGLGTGLYLRYRSTQSAADLDESISTFRFLPRRARLGRKNMLQEQQRITLWSIRRSGCLKAGSRRTSNLGFQSVQKTPIIHASSGDIWGIPD